jgi:hypothetical protein
MLLPKLAKHREFDPCKHWVVPVPDSHREKIRRGKSQEKNFKQRRLDQVLGFSAIYFFPSQFFMGGPPSKGDGNSDKGGRQATGTMAMATMTTQAMAMATTWAVVTVRRWRATKGGNGEGGKSNCNSNEDGGQ